MKMTYKVLPVALLLGALMTPLAAQAQVPYHHPDNLSQRFQDQHARIRDGVRSGQLTHREARADSARLHRVERQDYRDRARQGGHLTSWQRAHQNRELNRNSADIYRTKHNGWVR